MDERKFKINDTTVIIKFGDIFEQDGVKVIGFNEYFDTLVDDVIISRNTLNCKFIEKYVDDISVLDREIEKQIENNGFQIQRVKRQSGKEIQCKLGSIVKYKEFLLLAFSRFDDKNMAVLTTKEYIECLNHFWQEINRVYAGYPVSLSLLGSGMTRLGIASREMNNQDKLQEIINTFINSRIKLINGLTIVLTDSISEHIDLQKIET